MAASACSAPSSTGTGRGQGGVVQAKEGWHRRPPHILTPSLGLKALHRAFQTCTSDFAGSDPPWAGWDSTGGKGKNVPLPQRFLNGGITKPQLEKPCVCALKGRAKTATQSPGWEGGFGFTCNQCQCPGGLGGNQVSPLQGSPCLQTSKNNNNNKKSTSSFHPLGFLTFRTPALATGKSKPPPAPHIPGSCTILAAQIPRSLSTKALP